MSRTDRYNRALNLSQRVYKTLLAAYPKEFRGEYGSQMAQAFGDLCREELERGGMAGLIKLWIHTILDLVMTALTERSSSRANNREVVVKDYKLAGIGFVLLLAPLFFVSASLLKYGLGIGVLFDPLEAFCPSHRDAMSSTWSHRLCSLVGWARRWHLTRTPFCD